MFPIRSSAAFGITLWTLLWLFGAPPMPAAGSDPSAQLLALVNQERAAHHLLALRPSAELAAVARAHGLELVQHGDMSHTNRAGQSPLDRVRAAGIDGFSLLAENLGKTSASGDHLAAIMTGWRGSELHRENLWNPAFNTTGIAVLTTPSGETLAVQLFATF
jgi:uncharacterized protein YkwD